MRRLRRGRSCVIIICITQERGITMNEIYNQAMDKYTHYANAEDLKEAVRLFKESSEDAAE